MAQAPRNGFPQRETFHKFFECWLVEQDQHLQNLVSASEHYKQNNNSSTHPASTRDPELSDLVDRVIHHYEHYYRTKSRWAKEDALGMLSPSWRSTLEDAFLWIGGWRPSMAFHLLYSKSGLQLEAALAELIRGLRTGDLGDLSPNQLARIDEMQMQTIRDEKEIAEKMAKHQETVADSSMVELSHAVSEMIRNNVIAGEGGRETAEERVESALEEKEEGMEDILQMADDLRLRTLKGVIEILTPIQTVHFLIAAAELHLRFHEWGKKRDAVHNQLHEAEPTVHSLDSVTAPSINLIYSRSLDD